MPDIFQVNKGYVVVGASVAAVNLLALITFSSTRKFLAKYQLLIALAFADIIGGCGTFSAGYGRLIIYRRNPDSNGSTIADCMKAPWIPLMAIGGQLPAVILLVIGAERMLAVFLPIFYRTKYNNKYRSWIIVSSAAFVIGALVCAYGQRLIFGGMDQIVTSSCLNAETFSMFFNDFNQTVVVFGNLIGFCLSCVAFLSARRKSKQSGAFGQQMRSEVKRLNLLIIVSGFSVLLATLPQMAFWLSAYKLIVFPNNTAYLNADVFYAGSLVNFFIYLSSKKEFRARFFYLFTCGLVKNNAKVEGMVAPITRTAPKTIAPLTSITRR